MLQLLYTLDKWTEYIKNTVDGQIDAVYTDFEKAFDKMPHRRVDYYPNAVLMKLMLILLTN